MTSNRWSLRALTRQVGLLSITAVLTAGLVAVPASRAAKPSSAPKSVKTVAEATSLAAQFDTSVEVEVEVEDRTTEYSRTVATGTSSRERLPSRTSTSPTPLARSGPI